MTEKNLSIKDLFTKYGFYVLGFSAVVRTAINVLDNYLEEKTQRMDPNLYVFAVHIVERHINDYMDDVITVAASKPDLFSKLKSLGTAQELVENAQKLKSDIGQRLKSGIEKLLDGDQK